MVRRDITMRILPTMCMLFLSLCFQVTASPKEQGERRVSIDADNTTIKEILKRIENQTGVAFFYNTNHVNDKERISVNVRSVRFDDLMKEIFRERGISWSYNDDVVSLQTSFSDQGKKRVSFTADNITLKDVFKIIQKQTGLEFYYNVAVVNVNDKITLTVKDRPLDEVLTKILAVRGLGWQYYDKVIRIRPDKVDGDRDSSINKIDVVGKVTDASGLPIPGATIIIKGTLDGTTANENGEFTLSGVPFKKTLIIRSMGYREMEVQVLGKSMSVMLLLAVNDLDETVVMGYGTTTRRFNTGSISTVKADEIQKQPVANPLAALQGLVPGLQIVQNNGVPGSGFDVQLRGRNSISFNSNPLYIIDGVPYIANSINQLGGNITGNASPLNTINPLNIESIEVLKDADATAIYGSRGANGVILITTKAGESGTTRVDVNVYSGIGKVTRKIKLLNTEDYVSMRKEAFANDGIAPDLSNAYDLLHWDTTKYTDWQRQLIGGTATITNAQMSITGGNGNTQFLLGGNYRRETTVFPGDFSDKKASFSFNIRNQSKSKKFKLTFSGSYNTERNNLFPQDLTYNALALPPNLPDLVSREGDYIWPDYYDFNPLAFWLEKKYRIRISNLITNSVLSYELFPGLEIKSSFGYNRIHSDEVSTNSISANNPAWGVQTGSSSFANNSIGNWIVEPQISWQKKVGKGNLNVLVGATFQELMMEGESLSATGYTSDALLEDMKAAATIMVENTVYSKYRYSAVFGRLNYAYSGKYIVNVSGRRDGSSRFGPGRQFANFGAVGLGWIFSEEKFARDHLAVLSYGKLRGSYGVTGSDATSDYGFMDLWQSITPYQNSSSLIPVRLANSDYAWERTEKLEAAVELGLFNNRILLMTNFYRNRSGNQLVGLPLPPSVGFNSIQANRPALVQNTGWEFELTLNCIKSNNFNWNANFNITIPRNKLVSYPDFEKSPYVNKYEVGRSLNVLKAIHYLGVDPSTGIYQYQDVNKNGQGTDFPEDLQTIKELGQRYYGGFMNTFSFKRVQLSFLFQFANQTGYNPLMNGYLGVPGGIGNQPTDVLNRWRYSGQHTDIQKFTTGPGSAAYEAWYNGYVQSDNQITSASYIRLKNVYLSYSLPTKLLTRLKLRDSKVFFQAQNLLTLTGYKGIDPENQSFTSLPPLRMLTAGIQLGL